MAYTGTHLIAATSLPREVLISYHDDEQQTKLALRGLWQALHVYGQCWMHCEPLDPNSNLYKCRFSSSRNFLQPEKRTESKTAFLYLLSSKEVEQIFHAPITPIEWYIETDAQGNCYPINVFACNGSPSHLSYEKKGREESTPSAPSSHGSKNPQQERGSPQTPTPSQQEKALLAYAEHRVEEPVATYYEHISLKNIDDAIDTLYPGLLASGERPRRKDLAVILVQAMRFTLAHTLEQERNPRQIRLLEQQITDMDLMIAHHHVWHRDRDYYVTVLWTDELCGVCAVTIGIPPQLRVQAWKEAPWRTARQFSRTHAAKRSA